MLASHFCMGMSKFNGITKTCAVELGISYELRTLKCGILLEFYSLKRGRCMEL